MKDYFDIEFNELKKGFYKYPGVDELLYFTGKYEAGLAVFEKENEIGKTKLIRHTRVHNLSQVSKKEVEERIDNSKKKTNWLEKKLKD